ncbi:cell division protein ZipA C-terminal FtsZ-binding domain-containing protein [beta proteobacterium MWH-UniP1]
MTDLQIAISVAAVIAVTLVLAFNIREWSRAKKRIAQQQVVVAADEPVLQPAVERLIEPVRPSLISESIAELTWPSPCAFSRIQQEIRGWRRVGSKPLAFGWKVAGSDEMQAEPVSQEIIGLSVGVLLATRQGPLNAMEYSEWQEALTKLASNLGAQVAIPSMTETLAKARSVDQQCAAVDAQLTIAVTTTSVLSAASITSAAQAAGLESRGELRFGLGPLHQQRFAVFPGDRGLSLVLLLDVPRTADPQGAFQEMRLAAQTMAAVLSGAVTDEAGRPLQAADFERIEKQIGQKAGQLLAMGIEPGSAVAQRLFL